MAEELTMDIKANDKASDVVKKVQGQTDQFVDHAAQWNQSLEQVGTSSRGAGDGIGSMMGKAAKAGAIIGGVTIATKEVVQTMMEWQQVASDWQTSMDMLEQSVANAAGSAEEGEARFAAMREQVRQMADDAGLLMPQVSEAARQLTFRLQDADAASANLERQVGLMALTGKEAEDTAKNLAEALGGNINPLKEMGILTETQVEELNQLSDRGERTARALEIMDEKLVGVIERQKEGRSSSERMGQAWERVKASIGASAVIEGPLNATAGLLEAAADGVEDFGASWNETAPGIKANLQDVQHETRKVKEETENLSRALDTGGREQAERMRALADEKRDTSMWLLEEQVRQGEITKDSWDYRLAVENINKLHQRRIELVEDQYGRVQEALSQRQQETELVRLENQILSETDAIERARLQAQRDQLALMIKHEQEVESITSERERQAAMDQYEARARNIELQKQERIRQIREGRAKAAGEEVEADKDHRQYLTELLWLHEDITEEVAAAQHEATMEIVRANERRIEQTSRLQVGLGREHEQTMSHLDDLRQMADEEERIAAAVEARSIARSSAVAQGMGQGMESVAGLVGEQAAGRSDAMREQLSVLQEELATRVELNQLSQDHADAFLEKQREKVAQIERENRQLQRQMQLYGQLSSGLGELGGQIAELHEMQWNFEEATDAAAGGLAALSAVGGTAASLLSDNTQQQAGIQAGFEYAAAAGALGLALTTQNPAFYAAAGQHTLAGGLYTAVASGAVGASGGKGSVGTASGAGGGGGGGGAMAGIDPARERERTADAFAERLAALNEPRELHITVGYNAIPIGESPQTARVVADATRRDQQSIVTRGRS